MSSANLELVRSIHAAWERGDYSSAEWAHPEIEYELAGVPDSGSWRGMAAMAEAWRSFLSAWEDHRVEVDGYQQLDDERVLVLSRFVARGRASGLTPGEHMRAEGANLFHIRDGKVTRLVSYFDRAHALADVGLAPDAGSTRP